MIHNTKGYVFKEEEHINKQIDLLQLFEVSEMTQQCVARRGNQAVLLGPQF